MIDYIKEIGSIGIYFRYKDDFDSLFKFLNCSKSCKDQLFLYYFEMYVLDELLKIICDLLAEESFCNVDWNELIRQLNDMLSTHADSLQSLISEAHRKIKDVDQWVKRSRYLDRAEDTLFALIDSQNFLPNVCKCIASNIPELSTIRFLIIIDEYENAGEYQQILNTLVKQVDHTTNISYRIGVRPKGMITLETNIGSEFLQIDRDFLLYVLQSKKMTDYKAFIESVANRRLSSVEYFAQNGLTSIKELLGATENLDAEAYSLVKKKPKKHFEILKKRYDPDEYTQIVHAIENPSFPLMEMLNVIWVLRGVPYHKVKTAMDGYIDGKYKDPACSEEVALSTKYKLDYSDKYRYQLMFILLGIYGKRKRYYSFNTFAYLSSGAVNDFISLCRNVFYLLDESYYDRIAESRLIPVTLQADGAEKTAIEQMDKIRLCNEHGIEMYSFAMNIGELFKLYHRDIYAKYPETNQFAFENEVEIEKRPLLNDVRNSLIKWGVIIKKPRIQSISIGRRKGTLYYLNRIFSPIFGISYRTRGGYNFVLPTALFELLLKESWEPEKIMSWRSKQQVLSTTPKKDEGGDKALPNQISIFEALQ